MQTIAKENPLGKLKITSVLTRTHSTGDKVSVFQVEKTPQLQALHEAVSNRLAPYFTYDVTKDMIWVPARQGPYDEQIAESTLLWIKNYRQKASFDKFSPHITIGYGQAENLLSPIEFAVCQLALCHLGNHCTCRKVLISISIPC